MLFPQLEEKLQASKQALNTATSENIIEHCKQHLALLAEYRIHLYKLQDLPGVRQQSTPSFTRNVKSSEFESSERVNFSGFVSVSASKRARRRSEQ